MQHMHAVIWSHNKVTVINLQCYTVLHSVTKSTHSSVFWMISKALCTLLSMLVARLA